MNQQMLLTRERKEEWREEKRLYCYHQYNIRKMLTLKVHDPVIARSLVRFALEVQRAFSDRLVALYIARHPSIEIDGYNALIVLKNAKPEDQELAIKLAIESCRDLKPEDQIAPLVVGEEEVEGKISTEFRKKV